MPKEKICPYMSGPVTTGQIYDGSELVAEMQFTFCQKHDCPLYINPYTTEGNKAGYDCAKAWEPMMVDGQVRV